MKYLYLDTPEYNKETESCSPDYKIENGIFIAGWKVEKKPDEDDHVSIPEEQPDDSLTLREQLSIMEDAFAEL